MLKQVALVEYDDGDIKDVKVVGAIISKRVYDALSPHIVSQMEVWEEGNGEVKINAEKSIIDDVIAESIECGSAGIELLMR